MEDSQPASPQATGSVKAAINSYGERIRGRKPADKFRTQIFPQEDSPSKTTEHHRARANIGRLNETRASAETEKAKAESELSRARNAAAELASRIEESNSRARARRSELRFVPKMERSPEDAAQYSQLLRELDRVKKELSRLKLDAAAAVEAKAKAEKEIEASSLKAATFSSSVEELRKKIDEADEEHVLVELARIEAEKELQQIEEQRKTEAGKFAENIEVAKKRIKELRRELSRSKELETRLRVTNSDLSVLQGEMELVRAMEKGNQRDPASKAELESAEAELEAAKKELAAAKEENFQFMVSMDGLRKELIHIQEETNRLMRLEKKAETSMQHLNAKLLKSKSMLETASTADKRSKALVSNLSAALRQMQTEVEAAKKEERLITEEAENIRAEIDDADSEITSAEESLQAAMRELESVKASESMALKKLRNVTYKIMRRRAASIPHSSTVTISKSEYEYLNQQAAEAREVAAKKVEAAQAWVEALAAEEKEILLKAETIEKEIKEFTGEEVRQQGKAMEEEADELTGSEEDENMKPGRKSFRENSFSTPARTTKVRRLSTSSATLNPRSPSFAIKRRRVIPNFFRFLGGRKGRKQR